MVKSGGQNQPHSQLAWFLDLNDFLWPRTVGAHIMLSTEASFTRNTATSPFPKRDTDLTFSQIALTVHYRRGVTL